MVKGRSSPDDPDLAGYWENRRRKGHGLTLDAGTLSLLARQENRCPYCGDPFFDLSRLPSSPEEWEHWWLSVLRRDIPRAASARGTRPQRAERNRPRPDTRLLQPIPQGNRTQERGINPQRPKGLACADARKRARAVLRGGRRSNAPPLPDPYQRA